MGKDREFQKGGRDTNICGKKTERRINQNLRDGGYTRREENGPLLLVFKVLSNIECVPHSLS